MVKVLGSCCFDMLMAEFVCEWGKCNSNLFGIHTGKPEPLVSWSMNGELLDANFYLDRYGNVINELVFR